jgi:hypothetical protein
MVPNLELDVWKPMLEHIGFAGTATLIGDCRAGGEGRDGLAALTPDSRPARGSLVSC